MAQLAAARQGTHSTKTRGEVRGGGAQAVPPEGHRPRPSGLDPRAAVRRRWRRARPDSRATTPADPKKMKAAALRGALSDRARNGRVHVRRRPASTATRPSTKAAVAGARRPLRAQARARGARARRRADLEEPAQRRARAPARARPAQHVRRARLRRRGLHPGRARRVPGRPGHGPLGQGQRHREPRPTEATHESSHPQGPARHPPRAGGLREELRPARREQVHVPGRTRTPTRPRSRSRSSRSSASRSTA